MITIKELYIGNNGQAVASGLYLDYIGLEIIRRRAGIKKSEIKEISLEDNKITITGDINDRIGVGSKVEVVDNKDISGEFSVKSLSISGSDTVIEVEEEIDDETVEGFILYIDQEYVIKAKIKAFVSESYRNTINSEESKKVELEGTRIRNVYIIPLTQSQWETSQVKDVADNAIKAALDKNFDPENVVIS